jgi:hypothetical protein
VASEDPVKRCDSDCVFDTGADVCRSKLESKKYGSGDNALPNNMVTGRVRSRNRMGPQDDHNAPSSPATAPDDKWLSQQE